MPSDRTGGITVKTKRLLIVAAAIVIMIPALVSAQAARNTKEVVNNERQIAVDKKQLARDRSEVEEFERLLHELDTLREARAVESFMRLNTRLRTAMDRELKQARAKVVGAGREVNQSRREKRGERQEAGATGSARDYLQLNDDRRDLRDDLRDARAAAARADRMQAILSSSNALQQAIRRGNADAIAENRRLMGEFLEVLRADLAATAGELGEDRRERAEDRRERRTDRRK
jgi:hypothetical protein